MSKRTCVITKNECGTDTWPVVDGRLQRCPCTECQAYISESTVSYQTYEHPTEGLLVRATFFPGTDRELVHNWQRSLAIDSRTFRDVRVEPVQMLRQMYGKSVFLRYDGIVAEPPALRVVARVETQDRMDLMTGKIDEPDFQVEWGGACPVQGTGIVDGQPLYYRARGSRWSVEIGPGADDHDDLRFSNEGARFFYEEQPYIWPDGGWIDAAESERNIRTAVQKYRSETRR